MEAHEHIFRSPYSGKQSMNLLENTTIGDLEVPGRAGYRAIRTNLVDDGQPTKELRSHLVERAAGGTGLILGPAEMLVHGSASGHAYIDAYDEGVIPQLRTLVEEVHAKDSIIAGQLTHPGAESTGDWNMQPQLAPSPEPSNSAYEMPKQMDTSEIEEIKQGFNKAACNLEKAGFDAIELSAGPRSLIRQFLSPRFNQRSDGYGGSWESRARFLNETYQLIAESTEIPVGVHLSVAELVYGGYTVEDLSDMLECINGYDYISCTIGSASSFSQAHAGVSEDAPDMMSPIKTVLESVSAPVMGRTVFTTFDIAAELISLGVDVVEFTRPLIADPWAIVKYENSKTNGSDTTSNSLPGPKGIQRCIRCNQRCLDGVYSQPHGGHIGCVVNPQAGRESDFGPLSTLDHAPVKKDILVIGGGPAGLRFAGVAALRDHSITLKEKSATLGGQLACAADGQFAPFKDALQDLIDLAETSGVDIQASETVSAEDVSNDWDAIVVATGASRPKKERVGFEGDFHDMYDVIDGEAMEGEVLLWDANRWVLTYQTAMKILNQNTSLEIVTEDRFPLFKTDPPNLSAFIATLQEKGATFTNNHRLERVDKEGRATLTNTLTGEEVHRNPDEIVVSGRRQANESLYLELKNRFDDLYRIGDATAPRTLTQAYLDGEELGRRI